MNKLIIGLASIFAVFVAVTVFMDTFQGFGFDDKPESPLATRYGATVESALDSGSTEKEESMPALKTFTNTEYEYSIQYPDEVLVSCGKVGTQISESPKVCLYLWKNGEGPGEDPTMYIDVRDEDLYAERYEDTLELDLKAYADSVWQINKDGEDGDKDVSKLERIKIGGRTAYQFTSTKSVKTETGTMRVDDETVVILVDTKDRVKLMITYPENEDIFEDILDTLKFN